jgi:hypothetical protein
MEWRKRGQEREQRRKAIGEENELDWENKKEKKRREERRSGSRRAETDKRERRTLRIL